MLYYAYNGRHTVSELTDRHGAVIESYRYDAFGGITTGITAPYNTSSYTGQHYDDVTGLMDMKARWYDPTAGRFLQQDTWPGTLDTPWTQNRYAYVGNNPINLWDPTGNVPEDYLTITEDSDSRTSYEGKFYFYDYTTYSSSTLISSVSSTLLNGITDYWEQTQYDYYDMLSVWGTTYWETDPKTGERTEESSSSGYSWSIYVESTVYSYSTFRSSKEISTTNEAAKAQYGPPPPTAKPLMQTVTINNQTVSATLLVNKSALENQVKAQDLLASAVKISGMTIEKASLQILANKLDVFLEGKWEVPAQVTPRTGSGPGGIIQLDDVYLPVSTLGAIKENTLRWVNAQETIKKTQQVVGAYQARDTAVANMESLREENRLALQYNKWEHLGDEDFFRHLDANTQKQLRDMAFSKTIQEHGGVLGVVAPYIPIPSGYFLKKGAGLVFQAARNVVRIVKASPVDEVIKASINLQSKIEINAGNQLQKMEQGTAGAHFYSRHGAQTTLGQQYARATTGITPDGFAGRSVDSSRFLSNQIQVSAAQRAETIFSQTGKTSFTFNMGEVIGEGYKKGGGELVQTTNVTAVFRNGKLYTMYPSLSPLN